MLDHKFLNKIEALGHADAGEPVALHLGAARSISASSTRVSVHRDSCNESCTYFGPQA